MGGWWPLVLGIVVAGLALAVQYLYGPFANYLDEMRGKSAVNHTVFQDLIQWMEQHGANISKRITVNSFQHGGISIRGLASSTDISENDTLIQVPKRLWIRMGNYPEIKSADLSRIPACQELGESFREVLLKSAALALETKKGEASFYSPFLAYLPTLDEYRSFLPDMASDSIMREFRTFHFVRHKLGTWRFELKTMKLCFEAWKRKPTAPVGLSALDWATDMELARARLQTRGYNGEELGLVMVPLVDLANARVGTENARWSFEDDVFTVKSSCGIRAGSEVYEVYAKEDDNAELVYSWGMYFETNPTQQSPDSFNEDSCIKDGGHLRELVLSILEDPEPIKHANLLAPRCKVDKLQSHHQGQIRCSLARLSYETCSRFWF